MKVSLPTTTRLLTVLALCIVYALAQAMAFSRLVSFSFLFLFLHAFVDAVVWGILTVFLSKAIHFGNYVSLGFYQRIINYVALGLLTVAVWVGLSFLTGRLVFENDSLEELQSMLWMKAFIGMFIYIILVFVIHNQIKIDVEEEEDEVAEISEVEEITEEQIEIIDRVTVKIGQKIHVINVSDIIYIQSDGDYVQLYTETQRYLKEETMKYFETHLPSAMFVRVHRSYIVNVEKILRIELYEKRTQLLTLTNGYKIKTSASGYKLLRETLKL